MAETKGLTCCNIKQPCGQNEICCRTDDCGISCPAGEECCGSNTIRPNDGSNCFTPGGQLCTTSSQCCNSNSIRPHNGNNCFIPGGQLCTTSSQCCNSNSIRPNDGSNCFAPGGQLCTTSSQCFDSATQTPCDNSNSCLAPTAPDYCDGINKIKPSDGSQCFLSTTTCIATSACFDAATQTPCSNSNVCLPTTAPDYCAGTNKIKYAAGTQCVAGGTCTIYSTCCDTGAGANFCLATTAPDYCAGTNKIKYDTGIQCIAGGACTIDSTCCDTGAGANFCLAPTAPDYCDGINKIKPSDGSQCFLSTTTCIATSACFDSATQTPCDNSNSCLAPTAPDYCNGINKIKPSDGSQCFLSSTACIATSACFDSATEAPCGDYLTNEPGDPPCKNLCIKASISLCGNNIPPTPHKITYGCWETGHGSISVLLHAYNSWTGGLLEDAKDWCDATYGGSTPSNRVVVDIVMEYE